MKTPEIPKQLQDKINRFQQLSQQHQMVSTQLQQVQQQVLEAQSALDALGEARPPEPRIEVQAGENLAGTEVWVRVSDNGPGIEPERLQRIFSPFYTSKAAGTGLGLAISKKVVDAHGGSLEAHTRSDGGTQFLLTLPKQGAVGQAEER